MNATFTLTKEELDNEFLEVIKNTFKGEMIRISVESMDYSESKPSSLNDGDKQDFYSLSLNQLSNAYSDFEPNYTSEMIKESNPEYKP